MIYIRRSIDRGKTKIDWLTSHHTFSFGNYYDPGYMGFRSLRVINEDTVKPGFGFGRHSHDNMEIISYVIEGELEHKDSLGTGSVIKPGEIQRMSAGAGVQHSEFNPSKTNLLHFLQIWIIPEKMELPPSYEQKTISKEKNKLILIGSKQGGDGAVFIHQDVKLYVTYLDANQALNYELSDDRYVWLQLIKGKIDLNGESLEAGDGAAIADEKAIKIQGLEEAEFLIFDLN